MIRRLLLLGLVLCVLFIAQTARVGEVFGVQPNFALVFLLGAAYLPRHARRVWPVLLFASCALGFFTFAFFPFSVFQVVVMLLSVLGAVVTRRFLTGNYYADFGIGLLGAMFFFYAVGAFVSWQSVVLPLVAVEFAYNYALGCAAGFLCSRAPALPAGRRARFHS